MERKKEKSIKNFEEQHLEDNFTFFSFRNYVNDRMWWKNLFPQRLDNRANFFLLSFSIFTQCF